MWFDVNKLAFVASPIFWTSMQITKNNDDNQLKRVANNYATVTATSRGEVSNDTELMDHNEKQGHTLGQ